MNSITKLKKRLQKVNRYNKNCKYYRQYDEIHKMYLLFYFTFCVLLLNSKRIKTNVLFDEYEFYSLKKGKNVKNEKKRTSLSGSWLY